MSDVPTDQPTERPRIVLSGLPDDTAESLLRRARALNAGTMAMVIRDGDRGPVVEAVLVIRGEGADELYRAWEEAEQAVNERWDREDREDVPT